MRIAFSVVFAMCISGSSAWAQPTELEALHEACEEGHLRSCYDAGVHYQIGRGVPVDFGRAHALFEQACEGGDSYGCNGLGRLHEAGSGVPSDMDQALGFYQRACDLGDLPVCYYIGWLYEFNERLPTDYERSRTYYQRACDGGEQLGCQGLAYLLLQGRGVARDVEAARGLFEGACAAGSEGACAELSGNPAFQPDPQPALAAWLLGAAEAQLAAARGEQPDARYLGPDPTQDLRASTHHDPSLAATGDPPEVVAALIIVRWTTLGTSPSVHLDVAPYAFPDGRLRWAVNTVIDRSWATITEPTYLDNGPPELAAGLEYPLRVTQYDCQLPLFEEAELADFPAVVRAEIAAAGDLEGACADVAEAGGAATPWLPSVVWVGVIVRGNGHSAVLTSELTVEDGRAWLGPLSGALLE
jgi:hypothetical protein